MITLLEENGRKDFQKICDRDPVQGGEIGTSLAVYGPGTLCADFWLQRGRSGEPTAALCRKSGQLFLSAAADRDGAELAGFLRTAGGFQTVRGEAALMAELFPGRPLFTAPAMRSCGGFSGADHAGIVEDLSLDDLYELLRADAGPPGREAGEQWRVYTSHLFRHRLGFAAGIYRQGRLAATGGVYGMGRGYGVIASLETHPNFRGQGLASRIVRYLCDRLLEQGRVPVLLCANEDLIPFYNRLGFQVFARWAQWNAEAPA